jgi:tripartite-type tricarboxylate transporter receptor subunit TctC
MNRFSRSLFALALAVFAVGALAADAYPSKPVRIIVPYPPGGGTDILSRLVGKYLGESVKQSIVIENRPSANAKIGMTAVANAPPDGYMLLAIAAGPLNEQNLPQFAPVTLFAAPAYLLIVNPAVPAQSVKEFVALAKAQPGKLAYASSGGGAASHLAGALFASMTGIDLLHVPYKGVGAAVNDLLGGQVQMMIAPSQAVVPHVKAGRLRALGVTSGKRSVIMPDLPTISEAGVPGYEAYGWFGLMAPAATPAEIVAKLNVEINRVLQLPEVKERLLELGAEPANTSPEQFGQFIRTDNAKWAKLIKEQGIVIE